MCGVREGREEVKSLSEEEEVKGMGSRGVRDSEVIVTGRQKCEGVVRKEEKAVWSSRDAA